MCVCVHSVYVTYTSRKVIDTHYYLNSDGEQKIIIINSKLIHFCTVKFPLTGLYRDSVTGNYKSRVEVYIHYNIII